MTSKRLTKQTGEKMQPTTKAAPPDSQKEATEEENPLLDSEIREMVARQLLLDQIKKRMDARLKSKKPI